MVVEWNQWGRARGRCGIPRRPTKTSIGARDRSLERLVVRLPVVTHTDKRMEQFRVSKSIRLESGQFQWRQRERTADDCCVADFWPAAAADAGGGASRGTRQPPDGAARKRR